MRCVIHPVRCALCFPPCAICALCYPPCAAYPGSRTLCACQLKSGTPCYMAPELFQERSVHSSASDLWALGCVLYECAAGHPPFVSTLFTQLVNDILTTQPGPLPGTVLGLLLGEGVRPEPRVHPSAPGASREFADLVSPHLRPPLPLNPTCALGFTDLWVLKITRSAGASPEFADLVGRLLEKNPARRCDWATLRVHPCASLPPAPPSCRPQHCPTALRRCRPE